MDPLFKLALIAPLFGLVSIVFGWVQGSRKVLVWFLLGLFLGPFGWLLTGIIAARFELISDANSNADEFRKTKKYMRLYTMLTILVGPVVLVVTGILLQEARMGLAGAIFGLFFISMFCIFFVIWRCPACQGFLGARKNPRSCPRCGVALIGDACS